MVDGELTLDPIASKECAATRWLKPFLLFCGRGSHTSGRRRGLPSPCRPPLCSSSLSPSCAPPSLPATSLPRCSWLCSAPPADCSACYSAPLFLSPSGSAAHTAVCSYLLSLSHPPPIEVGRQWCVSRQRCCHDSMGWRQLEIESGPPA